LKIKVKVKAKVALTPLTKRESRDQDLDQRKFKFPTMVTFLSNLKTVIYPKSNRENKKMIKKNVQNIIMNQNIINKREMG